MEATNLNGAIAAFQRMSRHALACGTQSLTGLFLAESARLLREVQSGRPVDETEWLESLEAVRLASEITGETKQ